MGEGGRSGAMFDLHGDPFGGPSVPAAAAAPTDAVVCRVRVDPKAELLRGLRRRWLLLLPLALVLAVAGVFYVYERSKPAYRAECMIEVSPLMPHMVFTGEEWRAASIVGYYDDYVRTLVNRVQERPLLEAVIEDLADEDVAWAPPGVPRVALPDVLRARLELSRVRDTYLMAIGFADVDPEVVAPVVNAVARRFLVAMERESQTAEDWKIQGLETERERIREALKAAHAKLDGLAEALGSAMLDARQNLFYERINVLETGRTKLLVERAQAQGDLVAATARAAAVLAEGEDEAVLREIDADPTVREARTQLQRLQRQVDEATRGMKDEHPERGPQLRMVAAARERLAVLEELTRERLVGVRRAERRAEAERLLGEARERVAGKEHSAAQIDALMAAAREDLQRYGRAMFEGAQLRTEVDGLLRRLAEVDGEIERVRIESRAPSRVSLRTAGVEPGKPVKDKRKMMAGAAAAFSLVFAAGLALLLERLRGTLADAAQLDGSRLAAIVAEDVGGAALEATFPASRRTVAAPLDAATRLVLVLPADAAAATAASAFAAAFAAMHDATVVSVGADGADGVDGAPTLPELTRAYVDGGVRRLLIGGRSGWVVVVAPIGSVAVIAPLAALCDAVLIVAGRDRTRTAAVVAATAAVRTAGGAVDAVALLDPGPRSGRTRPAA